MKMQHAVVSAETLYKLARTKGAIEDLMRNLTELWGKDSATVLHLRAMAQDLHDSFDSESTLSERGIISRHLAHECIRAAETLKAAVAEMDALPKPG
jgi:hypothetical protein